MGPPHELAPYPSMSTLSLSTGAESEYEHGVRLSPVPVEFSSESVTSNTTKREYALLELLRSERTYASDLVLLRDYQIPLASGRLSSMSSIWPAVETTICQYLGLGPAASDTGISPATPPGSSAVAPRRLTTASAISAVSFASIFTLRPMKTKDVNVVFSNIEKLAAFSEEFLDQLESALGELIEGNEGEDSVGRLFLEFIPQMEPLYRMYIMNQSHALEHYHRLSKTFQFDVYFPRSQILAHKSSNAWDLPSLLIKPVQRLLNYPQLLAAIVAETPDSHGDKANLVEAHARIEELARGLNARWRQQKVVQEVLASAGLIDVPQVGGEATRAKKKGGLKVGLAASVTLGRIKSLRSGALRAKEGVEMNAEAEAIRAMGERLKRYEPFMMQFATETVKWADEMCNLAGAIDGWTQCFGRVIWMDPGDERSDTFEAFLVLIREWLLQLCDELKAEIKKDLLRSIDSFKDTMVAPVHLLEAMLTLEPLHYSPLNLNLEASESYVALRAQLFAELPTYLTLLDQGMAACILKFAHIQRCFYSNVHNQWVELWDGFKVDGEANKGATETLRVWWNRFCDVEEQLTKLNIARHSPEKQRMKQKPSKSIAVGSSLLSGFDTLDFPIPQPSPSGSTFTVSSASTGAKPRGVRASMTSTRQRRSGGQIPALYECRVVHPCKPPEGVEYRDLPFLTLVVDEVYEILQEAGHPATHRDLPLYVDEGEDCLLLVRNSSGDVGWALASFMFPVDERVVHASSSESQGLLLPS
ncbi:Dbl-like domain-containing protein [Ganoderma leucocontextum]|nr:Dbl-like domain-containing protein [Ganoderma leucocontextum]